MRVEVNRDLCEANGLCAGQAPSVFEVSDSDELEILREHIDPSEADVVDRAVRVCPKQALRVTYD
ncbi:MAG TPA: ferredoxin [Acidimicrobiales bacterium]|jgi:ferredoxin|nr:ferredoxin [Acidimicrobiales bacterium]